MGSATTIRLLVVTLALVHSNEAQPFRTEQISLYDPQITSNTNFVPSEFDIRPNGFLSRIMQNSARRYAADTYNKPVGISQLNSFISLGPLLNNPLALIKSENNTRKARSTAGTQGRRKKQISVISPVAPDIELKVTTTALPPTTQPPTEPLTTTPPTQPTTVPSLTTTVETMQPNIASSTTLRPTTTITRTTNTPTTCIFPPMLPPCLPNPPNTKQNYPPNPFLPFMPFPPLPFPFPIPLAQPSTNGGLETRMMSALSNLPPLQSSASFAFGSMPVIKPTQLNIASQQPALPIPFGSMAGILPLQSNSLQLQLPQFSFLIPKST